MTSPYRIALASVLGATLIAAAAARAELAFPVNDGAGVFDQPSVAMNGPVAHVAFIGTAGAAGPFQVRYAAVNGGADFTNLALPRESVIVTPQTIVDNAVAGNDAYFDARHPAIAMRSATEAVIFFQAKPTSLDTAYSLYRARVTLDNNAVVEQRVNLVSGIPAGDIQDVSLALVAADNTARIVYSNRAALTDPFDISFARVGLDNAEAAAPVAITASYPLSRGNRPIPNLKLDDLNRAHIAWAAEGAPGSDSGPIYYAMIDQTSGIDNMLIAPTDIMTLFSEGFSFPSVLVFSRSLITVIASENTLGELGYVQINPDAAHKNGLPAWDNLANRDTFKLKPPGEPILPAYRLFRPTAFYEAASGRVFMTGYGGRSDGTAPAGVTFVAFTINAAVASVDPVTFTDPFAFVNRPSAIDNDYAHAAFGFPGGKVVVFWSANMSGSANNDLDVTTVSTVAAWVTSTESGCAMVTDPARGAAGRIPGALLLFLPAAALAARRIAVDRGRRRAQRGQAPADRRPPRVDV